MINNRGGYDLGWHPEFGPLLTLIGLVDSGYIYSTDFDSGLEQNHEEIGIC